MEQPVFSLASYYGERKLAWKRICNTTNDCILQTSVTATAELILASIVAKIQLLK